MSRVHLFLLLFMALIAAFLADIAFGSVNLPVGEVWKTLTGTSDNLIYREIIFNHRLPKALTAILTGAALSIAGVLMQTLFSNPLAGPDVLGVTSGSSLGVALLTLGTSALPAWFISGWGQVTAAFLGAIGVLLLIIIASVKIRQTVSLRRTRPHIELLVNSPQITRGKVAVVEFAFFGKQASGGRRSGRKHTAQRTV